LGRGRLIPAPAINFFDDENAARLIPDCLTKACHNVKRIVKMSDFRNISLSFLCFSMNSQILTEATRPLLAIAINNAIAFLVQCIVVQDTL
jgi:hypothetical protein